MNDVIIHNFPKLNLRKLNRNKSADCCNCLLAEKKRLIDGVEGYVCNAALYDIKTLACFVPRTQRSDIE